MPVTTVFYFSICLLVSGLLFSSIHRPFPQAYLESWHLFIIEAAYSHQKVSSGYFLGAERSPG